MSDLFFKTWSHWIEAYFLILVISKGIPLQISYVLWSLRFAVNFMCFSILTLINPLNLIHWFAGGWRVYTVTCRTFGVDAWMGLWLDQTLTSIRLPTEIIKLFGKVEALFGCMVFGSSWEFFVGFQSSGLFLWD
jgi:hypothetical protein